jgi:hypothetical protein
MTNKKWVYKRFQTLYVGTSLEGVFETLKTAEQAERSGAWKNIILESKEDYDGHWEIFLEGQRLETDNEFEARVSLEKIQQENSRARDLAEYQRLKAKFEKQLTDSAPSCTLLKL